MANNTDDILALIEQMVADRTFSLEALEGVKKMKDLVESQGRELTELRGRYDALRKDRDTLSEEVSTLRQAARDVAAREQLVKDAEKGNAVAAKELELTKQFKGEIKEVLMAFVRNTIVKQSTYGSVAMPTPGGYPQAVPTNSETTTSIAED